MSNNSKRTLEEIKGLCKNYLQKYKEHLRKNNLNQESLLNQLLLSNDLNEIRVLLTPENQYILTQSPSSIFDFNISNFFILISFPISIPYLCIVSWIQRGTLDFLKSDGSILLEEILKRCKQYDSLDTPVTKRINMKFQTELFSQKEENPPAVESGLEFVPDANPLFYAAKTIHNTFFKNFDKIVKRLYELHIGKPLILASRIRSEKDSNNFLIDFRCQFQFTLAAHATVQIKFLKNLFPKEFQRINVSQLDRESVKPRIDNYLQRTVSYFNTFIFSESFEDLYFYAKKIDDEFLASPAKKEKAWLRAFHASSSYVQKIQVIENLINMIEKEQAIYYRDYLSSIPLTKSLAEEHKKEYLAKRENANDRIQQHLQLLPANYRMLSISAYQIYKELNLILDLLEKNEIAHAWGRIKVLPDPSAFIQYAFPELEAMYYQLNAIFHILNTDGYWFITKFEDDYPYDEMVLEDNKKTLFLYIWEDEIRCAVNKNGIVDRFSIPADRLGEHADRLYYKVKNRQIIEEEDERILFRVANSYDYFPESQDSRINDSVEIALSYFTKAFNILEKTQQDQASELNEFTLTPLKHLFNHAEYAKSITPAEKIDELAQHSMMKNLDLLDSNQRRIDPEYTEEEWEYYLKNESLVEATQKLRFM